MEATQNGAAAVGVIGDTGGKPLPTALFGFRKGDVLAAIDALMKSNAEQQRAVGVDPCGHSRIHGRTSEVAGCAGRVSPLSDPPPGAFRPGPRRA